MSVNSTRSFSNLSRASRRCCTLIALGQVLTTLRLFNFPSSLADGVTAHFLTDEAFNQQYVSTYQARLAESYVHATQFFQRHGIPYQEANAALFLMVNLGAVVPDRSLNDGGITTLLRENKVYITAGSGYRAEQPGWFRVVIAHPKSVLDEGLKRIIQAILPQGMSNPEQALPIR